MQCCLTTNQLLQIFITLLICSTKTIKLGINGTNNNILQHHKLGCAIVYSEDLQDFHYHVLLPEFTFCHSLYILSNGSSDNSVPPSKAISSQRAIQCFPFQVPMHYFFLLNSSRTCLHLLPRLPVTSILPSIFPSVMCFRRQFLLKAWPIQLTFLLPIVRKFFPYSLTLCKRFFIFHTICPNAILHASSAPHFQYFKLFLICLVKCPNFSTINICTPNIKLR